MDNVFPDITVLAMLAGVFVLALLVTIPLRRWSRKVGVPASSLKGALKFLAGRISFPLSVLVLTRLLFLALGLHPYLAARAGPADFIFWWSVFWAAVTFLYLIETLLLLAYARSDRSFPVPALLRNIVRFIIILLAAFVVLRYGLKIDISPLLASTALLTAVIGFALQGVLGNLLAGMSMHLTRSVLPSDWVEIGSEEGKVIATNWRETRLRTIGGHTIVIPNSMVASSVIRNLTVPTALRRHDINVGASYSDAPGEVIEALVAAAKSVDKVLSRPAPSAYVTEFQDYGINYVLRFWTERYHDRVPIEGDVGRMIWYRFKRRGIEIPFPMSDKLLNDFMAVVYRQRKMSPEEDEIRRRAADLAASDLISSFLSDEEGNSLLREGDLERLARHTRRVRFTEGEILFRQGEQGNFCYILVSGELEGRIEYSDLDGSPAAVFAVKPGSLIGEMSLVTGLPRTATVRSLAESELLELGEEGFRQLLSFREEIPERLAELVSTRAAANAAELERLREINIEEAAESITKESIFRRFLNMLHH